MHCSTVVCSVTKWMYCKWWKYSVYSLSSCWHKRQGDRDRDTSYCHLSYTSYCHLCNTSYCHLCNTSYCHLCNTSYCHLCSHTLLYLTLSRAGTYLGRKKKKCLGIKFRQRGKNRKFSTFFSHYSIPGVTKLTLTFVFKGINMVIFLISCSSAAGPNLSSEK